MSNIFRYFYIAITNTPTRSKILKINNDAIMIIFDIDNNIWFKFKNVLKSLGYSDIDHTMIDININEQYTNIKLLGLCPVAS